MAFQLMSKIQTKLESLDDLINLDHDVIHNLLITYLKLMIQFQSDNTIEKKSKQFLISMK